MTNVLVWGRYGNYGPDYPRNRVVESVLRQLGCGVSRFLPWLSALADIEYTLRRRPKPGLIWVPCFRQRDVLAASRYAKRQGIPLVFDPLISAYDKQVNERAKFAADSARARRLWRQEQRQLSRADVLVADTHGHADYFAATFGVPRERIVVVPVGAEESLFYPRPLIEKPLNEPLELTFFGTFIGLQGVDVLAEAIATWQGEPVRWRLLGEGSMKAACMERLQGYDVTFEGWVPIEELPQRLASTDAFLGIFGTGEKTARVIPNKVYQSLAMGRPVITARTGAYPEECLSAQDTGLFWAEQGSVESIHGAVRDLLARRSQLPTLCTAASQTYAAYFSNTKIRQSLGAVLTLCGAQYEQ